MNASQDQNRIEITCFQVVRNIVKDGEVHIEPAGPLCKTLEEADKLLPISQQMYPGAYVGARKYSFDETVSGSMDAYHKLVTRLSSNSELLALGHIPVVGTIG